MSRNSDISRGGIPWFGWKIGHSIVFICDFPFFLYIRKTYTFHCTYIFQLRLNPWRMGSSLTFTLFLRLIDVYLTTCDRTLFFSFGYYVSQGQIWFWILEVSAAVLAQLVVHLTAGREVAGSYPGTGPILRVLKEPRNECSVFALLTSRSSRGSVDHVKIGGHCPQLVLSC